MFDHTPAYKRDDLHDKGQGNSHGESHKNNTWQWKVLKVLQKVLVMSIVSGREGKKPTNSSTPLFTLLMYVIFP